MVTEHEAGSGRMVTEHEAGSGRMVTEHVAMDHMRDPSLAIPTLESIQQLAAAMLHSRDPEGVI